MEIEEKGTLTKYETLPKRKLYIAVYKLGGGAYFSTSNEDKNDLILNVQKYYGVNSVRIYTVDLE